MMPPRENTTPGSKGGVFMKKRGEIAVALALLGAASALCLKLMKKAGQWLDEDQRKMDEEEEASEEDFAE